MGLELGILKNFSFPSQKGSANNGAKNTCKHRRYEIIIRVSLKQPLNNIVAMKK